MKFRLFVILFSVMITVLFAQQESQTFLSLKQTGVEQFLQQNPEYDGRGTIVFILDTGVDMGIDGLTTTSTGEVKVIDVQDFTGQGDVEIFEADTDEEDGVMYFVNEDENYMVAGADKLTYPKVSGEYYIGLLEETLWKNSGSGASDVNGNGTEDDKFYVVSFLTEVNGEQFWVAYLDVNADGDLSGEKPLRNYKDNFDAIFIPNEEGLTNFTMGLNIFPDESRISFFFDDGSHGTHCAGIATGNKIGNNELYGVAPGAYLIGLKLGNNNFAGGATVTESMKKAYLYADKISKERKEPCIINMSFGVGSEIEGKADMELFLDELTKNNPYLYISTSNGNEGPGISTSGLPAATNSVFSSGAVLTKEVGSDLYGVTLDKDIILHFSSRGAEVSKPDIISPGACTSTVPNFSNRDRFWGTSMASPYSAGVMSLLLSAIIVEYPDVKVPSQLLYTVLRESAVKWDGYTHLDQGGGFINVMNAYELLKKYIDNGEISKFETYTVSAFSPNTPDGNAPNLYIRNGSYLTGNERFTFNISRNNFIKKDKFYRIYNLKSDQEWLIPIKNNNYLRNNQDAAITTKLDKTKLTEPGLYNGKIKAYRSDNSKFPEFEMMATVVIPYEFNETNNYKMDWNGVKVKPGEDKRYFLNVPAGATSIKINLSSDKDVYSNCWFFLHDPDGRNQHLAILNSNGTGESVERIYFDIKPGVWELDVLGFFRATNESVFNLSVEFDGINRVDDLVLTEFHNKVKLINLFNNAKSYNLKGGIIGYEKEYVISLNGEDTYEIPFLLKKGDAQKEFEVSLSKKDFNKTTDFALMIYDESGSALALNGLSYKDGSISISNTFDADSTTLKFVLIPGFSNEPSPLAIHIKEITDFTNGIDFSVKYRNRSRITLYPSIETSVVCDFSKPEQFIPSDSKPYGKIYFESTSTNSTELEIPVIFKF